MRKILGIILRVFLLVVGVWEGRVGRSVLSFYNWIYWGWDDGIWDSGRGSCSGILGTDGTAVSHRPGLHSGVQIKTHGTNYH